MADRVLRRLIEGLSGSPQFLAFRLNRYRLDTGKTWDGLAEELGIDADQIGNLALCRPPRPDQFVQDVTAIAGAVGMPAPKLANFLRRLDNRQNHDPDSNTQMAARDREE